MKRHITIFSLLLGALFSMYSTAWSMAAKPIDHIVVSKSVVAIAVEGVDSEQTMKKILDLCRRRDVHLSFFSPSQFIGQNPALVKQAQRQGHEFGIYGVKQQYWGELRAEDIHKEMVIVDTTLRQVVGKSILMKPPCNYYENTVLEAVREYNPEIKVIRGVNTDEWTAPAGDTRSIKQPIVSGDIISFTLSSQQSLTKLQYAIEELKRSGFQIVTVSDLLADVRH